MSNYMNKPKNRYLLIALFIVVTGAIAGWWLAGHGLPTWRGMAMDEHRHEMVEATDAAGDSYWTCPMHPQVRRDNPGNCPVCGMKLLQREDHPAAPTMAEGEVLYWYDPMKPEVQFDKPGKSPFMDMQLVPKFSSDPGTGYASAAADAAGVVSIDPRMAQNLGMRTAAVERGRFWQYVEAVGSVAIDERRVQAIESRTAGWIERLAVSALGDPVRRGAVVAEIYSPALYAAQQELLLATKMADASLIDASRERLRGLGAGPAQIAGVERSGTAQRRSVVASPLEGVVTEIHVRDGAQVTAGMPLVHVADLSQVWILVDVPEAQAGWIAEGRPAEARLTALPGEVFEGRVDYLYPQLDGATRSLRLRLSFANPELKLRPGMYASVTLFGGPRNDVLLIPSEALIETGRRNTVIVQEQEGRYRPVAVEVGDQRDGRTVVLSGLEEGQLVVTSGQFLIDSEASLQGAYNRMETTPDRKERAGDPPAGRMRQLGQEGHSPSVYGDSASGRSGDNQ